MIRAGRQFSGDRPQNGAAGLLRACLRGMARALSAERRCPACSAVFRPAAGTLFCPDCAPRLARRESGFCPLCGALYAWPDLPVGVCAACLAEKPPWKRLFFHGEHKGLLRELLLDLKFRGQTQLGSALGALLSAHPDLRDQPVDMLTPVPLHEARLLHRGYNQALELVRPLAAASGRSLRPELLRRIRATSPQTRAGRSERAVNVDGAFVCTQTLRGKHILLVDDTLTTGATMRAATAALLDAGAADVCAVVVSRVRHLSGHIDAAPPRSPARHAGQSNAN
jgi:ComF family protein